MDSMETETLAPAGTSSRSVTEAANEVSNVHARLPLLEDKQLNKYNKAGLRNLLEVFSVRFVDFREHDLKNMYGCLLLSALPPYVIFSRKFGDPLYTDDEGFVKLRGPDITTIASDFTFIIPQLFSYHVCADQFKEIDCGPIWSIYSQKIFDTLVTRRTPTQFGEIEVNFAVYKYGIEACIDVTLIDCQFSSGTVHGSITAQNSKLGEKGTSFLFKRDKGDGVSISISDCKDRIAQLPLARCKTVHPIDSSLTIYVSIWQSSVTGTQDQPIADEKRLEFTAISGGQEVKTIKGAACQVNVSVTWPEKS
ncbi:rRNA N-glycosidase [Rhynchospora pubera]|uniref:rRNA N-glycosidase n=1 Tax=Rhynchospora pubera TaxID=906938 RepID=A0AAV8CNI6_9POAL|nr:rRNA N-glycosidase [Rhynchospora pubera]